MTKRTLLLTRSPEQNQEDRKLIDNQLYHVYEIPLIETHSCHYKQTPETLAQTDWLFFTSSNAVHYFYEGLIDKSLLAANKIAVIGQQTAKAVTFHKGRISFMPSRYTSDTFIEEWLETCQKPQRILLPKSDLARSNISEALSLEGHQVEEQVIYENRMPQPSEEQLRILLASGELDLAFFASPSAWQRFYEVVKTVPETLSIGAIGPVTQRAIQASGKQATIPEEDSYTMKGLLSIMLNQIKT